LVVEQFGLTYLKMRPYFQINVGISSNQQRL